MLKTLQQRFVLTDIELVLVVLSLSFVMLAFCFIIFLLLSRLTKSYYISRTTSLRTSLQPMLNMLVVNEALSEEAQPITALQFHFSQIKKLVPGSFAKQVLIDQLLEMKTSVSGGSANALITCYRELNLHERSVRKLKGFRWTTNAKGLRELTVMNCKEYVKEIERFLSSKNATLRELSFIALMRLDDEKPLQFINHYEGTISPWLELNIHRHILSIDQRKVPVFGHWFTHDNTSVQLFALRMAKQVRQQSSVPMFLQVLNTNEELSVVTLAVESIGELEAFEHADAVAALVGKAKEYEPLSVAIVKCLGQIGDENHVEVLASFLVHDVYRVRFETVLALKRLGDRGTEMLNRFNEKNDLKLQSMLNHIAEPLLQ